ncbi:MAG: hypothetical protein ACTTKL_06635 [Treponema sp.]
MKVEENRWKRFFVEVSKAGGTQEAEAGGRALSEFENPVTDFDLVLKYKTCGVGTRPYSCGMILEEIWLLRLTVLPEREKVLLRL